MHTLHTQYQLVVSARNVLFDYLEKMASDHYVAGLEGFAGSSIRDLQVHVCNCYFHWLIGFAEGTPPSYYSPSTFTSPAEIRAGYQAVDKTVQTFLSKFGGALEKPIDGTTQSGKAVVLTPLQLFTHVITHEFHHKGQMLSMSRQLGYTPVDTDMIRT